MNKFSLFLFLTLIILTACDQAPMDQSMSKSMPQEVEQAEQATDPENPGETIERKVIKEGTVEFETNDLEKTSAKVKKAISNLKGYISQEETYEAGNRI